MYCMIVLYIHQVHLGLFCHISNKRRALTISHVECLLVHSCDSYGCSRPVTNIVLQRKFNTVYEGGSWEQIILHKAQLHEPCSSNIRLYMSLTSAPLTTAETHSGSSLRAHQACTNIGETLILLAITDIALFTIRHPRMSHMKKYVQSAQASS